MKELKLSNSDKVALVDDEDFERCNQLKWKLNGSRKTSIMHRSRKYRGGWISLANFILNKVTGITDHKDRNLFNNQKSNLREATYQQNSFNQSKQDRKTSSKYKGVCWCKQKRKWQAYITNSVGKIHLGFFKNEWDAAQVYNFHAEDIFGEFAHFNSAT